MNRCTCPSDWSTCVLVTFLSFFFLIGVFRSFLLIPLIPNPSLCTLREQIEFDYTLYGFDSHCTLYVCAYMNVTCAGWLLNVCEIKGPTQRTEKLKSLQHPYAIGSFLSFSICIAFPNNALYIQAATVTPIDQTWLNTGSEWHWSS